MLNAVLRNTAPMVKNVSLVPPDNSRKKDLQIKRLARVSGTVTSSPLNWDLLPLIASMTARKPAPN